jgi:hypothetical protein
VRALTVGHRIATRQQAISVVSIGVDDGNLHLATVTLVEIQAGIELTLGQDAEKAAETESWLDLVTSPYNLLPMDGPAFRCWTKLMHRTSDTL